MRFPEFAKNDDWLSLKIYEVCKITTGTFDANAMSNSGKFPFFTCAKEVYRIDKYTFDAEALLVSGNGANVGYIHYCNGKFSAYQRTYVLWDFNINIFFVKYFLEGFLKARIFKERRDGNTPYIVLDTLRKFKFYAPKLEEQTKIAIFLSLIDKRIELQNKIIKDYELLKKEINIKMFTHSPKLPTLRFKEFKNDLAIKKIKNIVEYSKSGGGTPNTFIKEYYNGTIPFLSISDITVQSKYIYSTNKHITELGLKNSSTWIVPINTVTLTMYASFGIPCIIKNNMCTSQAMYNMIINKNNNYEYVYYYLNFLKNIRYYNSLAEQGSQFNLNSSIIENINLFLPSLKEQLKIANFLSKLDEILLNVKCEKERLIKNKTFLLQNLFI